MALALKKLYLQKEWKDYKIEIEEMRKAVCYTSEDEAIAFAQTFCYTVIRYLWNIVDYKNRWKCRQAEFVKVELQCLKIVQILQVED